VVENLVALDLYAMEGESGGGVESGEFGGDGQQFRDECSASQLDGCEDRCEPERQEPPQPGIHDVP
jgi:hypothetical protein